MDRTGIQQIILARKRHDTRGILTDPSEDQLDVITGLKAARDYEEWGLPDGADAGADEELLGDAFDVFEPDTLADYGVDDLVAAAETAIADGDLVTAGALLAAAIDVG